MYSLEKRKTEVNLFIKYYKCATDVIRKLVYPNRMTLWKCYESYLKGEDREDIYRNSVGFSSM